MILTFSILGEFLDIKIDEWMKNFWAGNLFLAIFSIALAGLVAFVLIKNNADSPQPTAQVEYTKKEVLLAFFSQLALVQIYFKPFEVTSADQHWFWVIVWTFYYALFYGATSYCIPILLKGFAPRVIIVGGLFLYGISLFLYLITNHLVNFAILALQGIALAMTMVPCMIELKHSGANPAGAAFVYELGYSLNILVWAILSELLGKVFSKTWIVLLIECIIAIAYGVLYFVATGAQIKNIKGSGKYSELNDEETTH